MIVSVQVSINSYRINYDRKTFGGEIDRIAEEIWKEVWHMDMTLQKKRRFCELLLEKFHDIEIQ